MAGAVLNFLALFIIIGINLSIEAHILRNVPGEIPKTCGYEACPKIEPNKLNVHIVAHTHDDVGWLKTVDQYYYGSRTATQNAGVQYILDSVIEALRNNPDRRFIYVETAFLWKWWQRQNKKIQEEVRSFINRGQLEIIGGSWSMNDEATTYYQSIIDQSTWGFRRLNDTFGKCARPKIGWQIDPFGHSREQASLFAQFGFDGMFFGRLDYEDKTRRLKDKTAEFIWNASPSLGKQSDLFSVALYNTYSPPPGFCFDILCSDDPLIDDPKSPDNNIEAKVAFFSAYCQIQAQSYNTNNIIITMGNDFTYQNAHMWFVNLDKLIRYTNELNGTEMNVFYSTPSCYMKSVNDAQKLWTTKKDDFFPYSSDPHAFWTGYFTSRPTLKFFERMGNNFLQIVKQLTVTSNMMDSDDLENFREVMGVMQHHDAVTGTEKQHVAQDYARLLHESIINGAKLVSTAMDKFSTRNKKNLTSIPTYQSCLLLNISSCTLIENSSRFVVTLYNPTSQPLSSYIRIPVQGTKYLVFDAFGTNLTTQLIPISDSVRRVPGRHSDATRELIFHALDVPALGYKSYWIDKVTSIETLAEDIDRPASISSIGGRLYNISVNNDGGVVINWNEDDLQVIQTFHYYEGTKGNNSESKNRASGAYIFRPKESMIHNFAYAGNHKFYTGPLVEELHLTVNDYISQIIRVYTNENNIEFDWLIGPIPVNDSIGREVVTRYSSNLASNSTFYTDSNGREMLKRIRNYRPTWNLNLQEPIAGNYYPVTAKISLQDKTQGLRLSVLNDRAQGGTSMRDGELELMLHRRLLNDDAFGVGEALNEQAFGTGLVAQGTHRLFGSNLRDVASAMLMEKSIAIYLAHRPWPLFTPLQDVDFNTWKESYAMEMSTLRKKLPPNVQILTYEPWKNGKILLRLEHLFETGEAGHLSQSVEINLSDLFIDFDIISIRETTLGGNQWIEEMDRLKWQAESNDIEDEVNNTIIDSNTQGAAINILLKPMEIRTFIITERNIRENR